MKYEVNKVFTVSGKIWELSENLFLFGETREFSENFVETRETFVEIFSSKILFLICDLKLLQFFLTKCINEFE